MTASIPALLQPLKDRLAAATPNPDVEWEALTDPGDRKTAPAWIVDADFIEIRLPATYQAGKVATLIANIPTDQAKLIAAIERVAGMHVMEFIEDGQYSRTRCEECLYEQTDDEQCPTVAALTQALGGDTA